MSTEGGVFVRIGGQIVPLILQQFVAMNEDDDSPPEASAPIRCDTCGALNVIGAPITYIIYDHEYLSRFELYYKSSHRGDCTGCGAAIEVELHYRRRGPSSRELREFCLTGVMVTEGGKLASTEGIAIQEEELRGPAPDLSEGDSSGEST